MIRVLNLFTFAQTQISWIVEIIYFLLILILLEAAGDDSLSHLKLCGIGPPKIHRRFCIGLPQVFLNLLPAHHNSTVGEFWCTMAIMKEKQQNFLFEIECADLSKGAQHYL